jgi:hypothetical protein
METKPGFKTTEFWTAILGAIGLTVPALLAALGDRPWVAAVLAAAGAILPAVYVWGRAILKTELAKQTNLIPDNWEATLGKALDVVEALAAALPKVIATQAASTAPAGEVSSPAGGLPPAQEPANG